MRENGAVARTSRKGDHIERFGESADLVGLDEDGVSKPLSNALGKTLFVGDEKVVAHQHHAAAKLSCEHLPARVIILGKSILDGEDGITVGKRGEIARKPLGIVLRAALRQAIAAILLAPFACCHIQCDLDAIRVKPRLTDGVDDQLKRCLVTRKIGGEAALVTDGGGEPLCA